MNQLQRLRNQYLSALALVMQLLGLCILILAMYIKNPLLLTLAFPMGLLLLAGGFITWLIYLVINDKFTTILKSRKPGNLP